MRRQISISCAGDVLTQPITRLAPLLPEFEVTVSHQDIDQIHHALAEPARSDVLIVHASSDFFLEEADAAEAIERMDGYCAAVEEFVARESALVILNTIEQLPSRIVGTKYLDDLELHARLNGKIFDLARRNPHISVVDAAGIIATIGSERALSLQNRLVMRMPYTKPAADALAAAYAQTIRERFVARKKVVVLDADNTLWGGIVGEDGVEGIAIDRQYPGTVYRRFQQQLLGLSQTGVLLALVSKNNLEDVIEVFQRHSMPLTWNDFVSVQVNWETKSDNILRIAEDLNLGLDSMVFVDDNPFELEQVKAALPDIDVYRFEADKPDIALKMLASINGLKTWSLTDEDSARSDQYSQERQRSTIRTQAKNLEENLRSLDIRLEIGRNRKPHVRRIAQLTNKTNQFNLTTKRYSEADILSKMEAGTVFDIRIIDRFGDMGIIGVIIVIDREIDTFLMSCRALGRDVEKHILDYVCRAFSEGELLASYLPTRKNQMVAEFYDSNGFELIEAGGDGDKKYRLRDGPKTSGEIPVKEVD